MTVASDLSAKLLATENVTVVRSSVSTASFDVKSRILTLPMWKDMTPEIEDMLIAHEVGHALYTDNDQYTAPMKKNPALRGYMNVLEDVRIEKLIKRKYPGLRRRMTEGYRQINDKNFFDLSGDVNEQLLIDRINLWFKVGMSSKVAFDSVERDFIQRAERLESIPEVVKLAEDIFVWSKAKREAEKKLQEELLAKAIANGEMEEDDADESDEYDSYEDDEDGYSDDYDQESMMDVDSDEQMEEEGSSTAQSPDNKNHLDEGTVQRDTESQGVKPLESYDDLEDEADYTRDSLEAKTQAALDARLEEAADINTQYINWTFGEEYISPVISYKHVIAQTDMKHLRDGYEDHNARVDSEYEKFMQDSNTVVNYMVKEFEMKKSAQLHKRAQTSKSGSLDMRKIYGYKIKDDLFKRITILPEGKNHAMMILVDWSGSMDRIINDTLSQVINLAMFCNRAKIPYKVLAFTNGYRNQMHADIVGFDKYRELYKKYSDKHQADLNSGNAAPYINVDSFNYNLLELLSSKMTSSEFNTMTRRLKDWRFMWVRGFGLSQTPLNEALVWVYNHMGDFIKETSAEKISLITLSDGAGSQLNTSNATMTNRNYVNGVLCKTRNFITDSVTRKTYEIANDSYAQTILLNKMIKDRWNVTTMGYYIVESNRSSIRDGVAINKNLSWTDTWEVDKNMDKIRSDFKQKGYYSVAGTGRDEFFLVPRNKQKITVEELDASADMTSAKLARNFSKFLNTKKTSRVLLNRFVDLIA